MKGHEHKYIAGVIGDECEFCGLLKSTIEALEKEEIKPATKKPSERILEIVNELRGYGEPVVHELYNSEVIAIAQYLDELVEEIRGK